MTNMDQLVIYSSPIYEKAAYQKSPYAIGKVIYYYEEGFGVEKNLEKALLWRQFLPSSWQKQDIMTYMNYVSHSENSLKIEESMNFPLHIQPNNTTLPFPDPNDLLPEVNKQIQENTKDLYQSKNVQFQTL